MNDDRPTVPPPELVRAHPRIVEATTSTGVDLDDPFEEITSFAERASESEPWLVVALFDLGLIHEMRGETLRAIARYDEAVAHLARFDETEHKWLYDITHGARTRRDWLRTKAARGGSWLAALATYGGVALLALGLDLALKRQPRR